ncbi:MAG: carboxylating nicotinate-nucleotide diphosphorylase [Bacteroidales bacterium]|jgi:nicotinate-nucleotide pyrophosphorylase (carboxylating)
MTVSDIIKQALKEDIGNGDYTSLSTVPSETKGKCQLKIKESGVVSGVNIAKEVFLQVDNTLEVNIFIEDGTPVKYGDIVMEISGSSISMLTAERTALNFMQRMSGIATYTRKIVDKLKGFDTKVVDTRKTTPLLRQLEKQAVRDGGAENHRFGLYDMILIKDNHIDFAGGISNAIGACVNYLEKNNLNLPIEIETRNIDEVNQVLAVGKVNRIMLDNFSYSDLKKAVKLIDCRYETEASGGVNLSTVRKYARCGVDYVSIGALTHHISSLDMSLLTIS